AFSIRRQRQRARCSAGLPARDDDERREVRAASEIDRDLLDLTGNDFDVLHRAFEVLVADDDSIRAGYEMAETREVRRVERASPGLEIVAAGSIPTRFARLERHDGHRLRGRRRFTVDSD